MKKKLEFNALGLQKKTDTLISVIIDDRNNLPKQNLNDFRKLTRYLEQLEFLRDQMKLIISEVVPFLEKKFKTEFKTPEILLIAFARPSTRNIYENLKSYCSDKSISITDDEFEELAGIGGAGEVLALLGDAVLDMATVEMLWDSSYATKGKLTDLRKNLVSNEALAKLCDDWGFYEYRLYNPQIEPTTVKDSTVNHEKGTLIEAVFGSIYLEYGYDKILEIVPKLQ